MEYGLGRRERVDDDRDLLYPLRALLTRAPTELKRTKATWGLRQPVALYQRATGTCVGHGGFNWLRARPTEVTSLHIDGVKVSFAQAPFRLYRMCVAIDEWEDNNHEVSTPIDDDLQSGTRVRALMKVLQRLGYVQSYAWAFDYATAQDFVLHHSPVILGINWYESMFTPDKEGIIRIERGSRNAGGHCVMWRGSDLKRGLDRWTNSWNKSWGINGECLVPMEVSERLIHEHGEVACGTQQKLQPVR